ncbi:MAG: SgcQ protein, partial [Caldilineaceae bacterium]|nr:SgcQ protein [Caldilineaceae bacterium]
IAAIARSTEFNAQPDALCVSGLIAGAETDAGTLAAVKGAVQRTPVFANTGVRADNVAAQLAIADGAIVGTTFKVDGYIWSDVDQRRVAEFMQAARAARG